MHSHKQIDGMDYFVGSVPLTLSFRFVYIHIYAYNTEHIKNA
jgi:hypothetical protein